MTDELLTLALALLLASSAMGDTLHVAPDGDDGALGTAEQPFATLERARDEIRERKAAGGLPDGGVTVEIGEGIYSLNQPFVLSAEDNGTPEAPIVYRAAKGVDARIIGGAVVAEWQKVTDTAILGRVGAEARESLLQADLRAQGVTDYGEVVSAPVWANSDPGLELFCNDERMTVARWPNDGYAYIGDLVVDDGHDIFGIPGSMTGQFLYEGDRPNRWVDEPDIMLHGYWFWDWADQRIRVESIDTTKQQITLEDVKHGFGFRKGQWYYAYNLLCELDEPGEGDRPAREYESPGMQRVVDVVREVGATNIVVVGGLDWAYDLSGIVEGDALEDPMGNGIMYDSHIYPWKSGWEQNVLRAARVHPVLVGECGCEPEPMPFIPVEAHKDPYEWAPNLLGFIQGHRLNWTAWCFHPSASPRLIEDWDYTPTPFWGDFVKRALAGEAFEMEKAY